MNKKGELTTQQIVTLVILIISFAVILFFLFKLNLGSETDKEICHNSVVTRANSVLPASTVPLKCKREYVCITEDGSCEKMTRPTIKKVKSKEDVYEVLAEELANCWWMFGEGKLNYVGDDFGSLLGCVLCSQIAFDDSIKDKIFEKNEEFDKSLFYSYLKSTEFKNGETYSDYLEVTDSLNLFSGDFGSINLDKQYYSLTGMRTNPSYVGWIAGGALLGAGLTFAIPTGGASLIVSGIFVALGGAVGGAAGGTARDIYVASLVEGKDGNNHLSPDLVEVNSQQFKDLKCEEILTKS